LREAAQQALTFVLPAADLCFPVANLTFVGNGLRSLVFNFLSVCAYFALVAGQSFARVPVFPHAGVLEGVVSIITTMIQQQMVDARRHIGLS
jgi:hypothetical protein